MCMAERDGLFHGSRERLQDGGCISWATRVQNPKLQHNTMDPYPLNLETWAG